jgi:N-acyl-D-amino-acid deacylase
MKRVAYFLIASFGVLSMLRGAAGQEQTPAPEATSADLVKVDGATLRQSISRAIPLLERASAGSAEQRQCFTCHSQALPVFVFAKAQALDFEVDTKNFKRQVEHAYEHLKRGIDGYREGKQQGGGVDTSGYALWTLEDGAKQPDEVTDAVVEWMLGSQSKKGFWSPTSERPPTQGSRFTSTYLAIRALSVFGRESHQERIDKAKRLTSQWVREIEPLSLEDRVFQLLMSHYVAIPNDSVALMSQGLVSKQRDDGGWAQLDDMQSDAYATASALYALEQTGLAMSSDAWQRGIRFLIDHQREDGSWHVATRSKPIQKYFETGFPHEKDQFISTYATGWATLCLLKSLSNDDANSIK